MLRRIDRILIRVPQLLSAVRYYRDVLGMKVLKQTDRLVSLQLADHSTELVLHADPDLPTEAIYYLVDDVRDLYERREELQLTFVSPPSAVSSGFLATVKDPFGNVLLLLDHTTSPHGSAHVEDAKPPAGLFAGVEQRTAAKRNELTRFYEQIGRTADDLPYTPHFESLFAGYGKAYTTPPTRQEVWRHLLNLRKAGKLPKLGDARSHPPEVPAESREYVRALLGTDIGRRDRLPYTERFDQLVVEFNTSLPRPLSPHAIWRLVATIAK
jgi:catechol 2,3-dioxygenase-like lactoylglutathione lyase family enzyme